jgi:hypothetical protein
MGVRKIVRKFLCYFETYIISVTLSISRFHIGNKLIYSNYTNLTNYVIISTWQNHQLLRYLFNN